MNLQTEPAVIIGAIGGIITALIPLLAKQFGWTDDVATEWKNLLEAVLVFVGFLITAFFIRRGVYSPATVAKMEGGDGPIDPS